jgi:hypothetical protein
MAKCKFCGEDIPRDELFRHFNTEHPAEMKQARARKSKKEPEHKPTATTMNPVQAAIMEFVGEKLQMPMTPALIYGYFCAKKMGFNGNVAEFLQEVIDDFFQARGINYYEEVMRWEEIGKKTTLEEEMKELQQKIPVSGIAAK